MVSEDNFFGNMGDDSPLVQQTVAWMDKWLTNLLADKSADAARTRINRAKPADLVDACYTDKSTVKIVEQQVYEGDTRCNQLYKAHSSPRQVAGDSVAMDVLKCQLKPLTVADYKVTFTPEELVRLNTVFRTGVCDYGKPGVSQQAATGTWLSFGP
jgi:hypothetical protein